MLCAAVVLGLILLQSGSGDDSNATAGSTSSPTATTTAVATSDATDTATSGTLPTLVEPTATAQTTTPSPQPTRTATEEPEATHTPQSGLPTIAEADLPPEAWDTMQLIYDGGPYPYRQDDGTFMNREGILPDQRRGYYREYTVETPGWHDRGARRIVSGRDGDLYYTDDHYSSFRQIMERQ